VSLHSWLHNFRSARAPDRDQRKHRRRDSLRAATHRLNLEVLEDRVTPSFSPATSFSVGPNPQAVVTADFNNDGHLDLATANAGASSVSVLLGHGDGTFSEPALNSAAGGAPFLLAAGDFNADGKLDLVTAYQYGPYVSVLLGGGDGTFQAPSYVEIGGDPTAVVVGDFNADGKVDLGVTANVYVDGWAMDPGGYVSSDYILLGNGDGTFQAPTDIYGGWGDTSVAVGDFNRDGQSDIATADASGNSVSIVRGLGNGAFSTAENFAAGPGAVAVAAGDFNGDGWLDIATANASDNSVSVLINDQSWSSPPPPPPSLRINDATVTEGNTGTFAATFTVTLSAASTQPVTVAYATGNGTATAGSDYQAASGTLTFAPGETSKTVTVLVNGDRLGEPNETFFVNLSGATNATIADGQGVGTIVDDEPRISISDVTKSEGKKGGTTLFTFTVTLSAAYDQAVTLSYGTVNGTATKSDKDYVAQTGTLTFAPGQTTKTITILVNGDGKREADEYFYLDLFGNSSNSLFTKSRGTGTILNDD
jgi:hypothetical protein